VNRTWAIDPPNVGLHVVKIVKVDFTVFAPPVRLGSTVSGTLQFRGVLPFAGEGGHTLDGAMRYLVTLSDGSIVRSGRDAILDYLIHTGQNAPSDL
jgi:hypothetical protein